MTSVLGVLLPPRANNDFRGGRIALVGFCLLLAQQTFSATVHFLTPDGGKQKIAGIVTFSGDPDPDRVIHMFASIAGSHEMLFMLLYGIVLWRYRNLIPLSMALMLAHWALGFVMTMMRPLTPEYFEHTPPALIVRLPMLLVISVLLATSIVTSRRSEGA